MVQHPNVNKLDSWGEEYDGEVREEKGCEEGKGDTRGKGGEGGKNDKVGIEDEGRK